MEELGRLAAREQDRGADQVADLVQARQRFLSHEPGLRHLPRWLVGLSLAAAAAVLLFGLTMLHSRSRPLAFEVGEHHALGKVDAWLAAPGDKPLLLRFSDTSKIALKPGTKARVTALAAAGAEVLLESGGASVFVAHRPKTSYKLKLGPFLVRVTGTRFDVDWSPAEEELILSMREGQVTVSGCVFGEGRPVDAGERVRAWCKQRRVEITALESAQPASSGAPLLGAARAEPAEHGASALRDSPPLPSGSPLSLSFPNSLGSEQGSGRVGDVVQERWQDLARRGQYEKAFSSAQTSGLEAQMGTASAADLMALGDAARYTGRLDQAELAYRTLRSRFPSDPLASVAAFTLGRAAFDQRRNYVDAAAWFRTYLREQPSGALARNALGRLMEALSRSGDRSGARGVAAQYVERYPGGPHAEAAKQLLAPAVAQP
jgi:TolA-binding protein